ncbi:hypothetical protein F7725_018201 [Dissostichus mawsoni]|uniref:Uncharacterized protein n=1 Tax=Dissostichus mawsoni TaxID=36200 RepID=A0A7J5XQV4_DISMA|nr:hypothetical protein F7725_018201 [Dissostichus mawsoni]
MIVIIRGFKMKPSPSPCVGKRFLFFNVTLGMSSSGCLSALVCKNSLDPTKISLIIAKREEVQNEEEEEEESDQRNSAENTGEKRAAEKWQQEVHQFGENNTVNKKTFVSLLVMPIYSRGWTLCRDTVFLYY